MRNCSHEIIQYEITTLSITEPQALVTVSEPEIVMFCQITCYNNGGLKNEDPAYAMLALAAMKRLNFRVHPPTTAMYVTSRYIVYLCEHTGDGADWKIVQSSLRSIVQGSLILGNMNTFHSPAGDFTIQWKCG